MMLVRSRVQKCLREFDFEALFVEELGWNRCAGQLEVAVGGANFALEMVAEKRGMVAFRCDVQPGERLPDYPTRRKIERMAAKSVHEHLIVYCDETEGTQVWQWVKREIGKPAACREHRYHSAQPGESLIQKLERIAFTLEEEEGLTLFGVTGSARKAFDVERVTKRFYDRFKAEHATFLRFLKGIPDEEVERWYASVMLNRLMFIYFIQKKGFLDADQEYLGQKLAQCRTKLGKDRYYRDFLCPLFFEGFAKEESDRSEQARKLLGKVPYLNGGIFMRHQIEQLHGDTIEIPDKAFEKLFEFFGAYRWHLDERPLRADDEINPDVLGYIFEKYINQKQMGAYYTKEDITGYISQNTVIPFLFDAAREKCKVAFEGERSVWRLLQDDPDRYVYPAVKYGVELLLPPDVAEGLDAARPNLLERRKGWNKPAPGEYALPAETWREVVARRTRYEEVRGDLAAGEVSSINDLITHNLDIRQFAQDVVENAEGPELLVALWNAINRVTVLDPTCGSGAFLFAALNILEPLYEACLERMQFFLDEWGEQARKTHPNYSKLFTETLKRVEDHPNHRYFVLKSIVINNLYGVDIMEEAVEICKLRLFLKLVSQIERVEDIEPLPDIDFNVLAGNTLVGFASLDEVRKTQEGNLGFGKGEVARIEEAAVEVDRLSALFREQQTRLGGAVTAADKENLRSRLGKLTDKLGRFLAAEYSVSPSRIPDKARFGAAFEKWSKSHQPFHWFAEFHAILSGGGFDVIIGNPPYVSAAKVRREYSVQNFATNLCPDIYAACVERSLHIVRHNGRFGMILPISFQFGGKFEPARRVCRENLSEIWVSAFSRNPSALFTAGLGVRNTICVGHAGDNSTRLIQSSRLQRWVEDYRPSLFQTIEYASLPVVLERYGWPRLDSAGIGNLFESLALRGWRLDSDCGRGNHSLRFKTTALYYISAFVHDPPSYDESGSDIDHTKVGTLRFTAADTRDGALVVALSKLALLWWASTGDDFDVTAAGLGSTPIRVSALPQTLQLCFRTLAKQLQSEMARNVIYTRYAGKWMGNYDVKEVRSLTDTADMALLKALALEHHWDDLELAYYRFLKATGERPGTLRAKPLFGRVLDSGHDDDENE